jgi:hypothetical protein
MAAKHPAKPPPTTNTSVSKIYSTIDYSPFKKLVFNYRVKVLKFSEKNYEITRAKNPNVTTTQLIWTAGNCGNIRARFQWISGESRPIF